MSGTDGNFNNLTVQGSLTIAPPTPPPPTVSSKLSIFSPLTDQAEGMIHLRVTDPISSGANRLLSVAKRNSSNTALLNWIVETTSGDTPGLSVSNVVKNDDGTSNSFPTSLYVGWDGKVGIGTTSPQQNLSVNGALTVDQANVNNGSVNPGISFGSSSGEGIASKRTSGGNQSGLDFYTGSTARLSITNAGNVGIGTTNPSRAKLEISGMVGNTVGLFGQGAQGMSLVASWPSLGFNSYFNSGWKSINAGWSGVIDVDQGDGAIQFYTTSQSSSGADAPLSTLTKQVRISSSGQLNVLNSGLTINGDFTIPNTGGGIARLTNQKFNNEAGFKNNNVKLSLASTSFIFLPNQPPLEYEFIVGHTSQSFVSNPGGGIGFATNFVKKFSINQNGEAYFAGAKTGFVADYFVNRVGDTLEQGDVVVISEYQIFHYSGTDNNIPILEVDLTETAYDSHVCGIVAKFVTEQDLPYVEIEHEVQAPPEGFTAEMLEEAAKDTEPYLHPLRQFAAEFQEDMDRTKVQDGQMGLMVTLGAFAHCKVDADIASIEVGDLLTTSPTKGHAQKVLEPERAIGAIIGKALASLEKGKGTIPILVMLQ